MGVVAHRRVDADPRGSLDPVLRWHVEVWRPTRHTWLGATHVSGTKWNLCLGPLTNPCFAHGQNTLNQLGAQLGALFLIGAPHGAFGEHGIPVQIVRIEDRMNLSQAMSGQGRDLDTGAASNRQPSDGGAAKIMECQPDDAGAGDGEHQRQVQVCRRTGQKDGLIIVGPDLINARTTIESPTLGAQVAQHEPTIVRA
jgi:hypothetical protein